MAQFRAIRGFPPVIDPDHPLNSYDKAMPLQDRQEWANACVQEFRGFKERNTFAVVIPEPGAKIMGTTTRTEYKTDNDVFQKRKVCMCVRGDQQRDGEHFDAWDLYAQHCMLFGQNPRDA